ncbi:MAG: hypothetical protein IPN36_04665 [Bacteroidetes bacterium]|nr:hypothetical protein [Bacteroidota bacterium]
MHDTNCSLAQKFSKIKYALIIDDELSIENNTLTPSMKMAPKKVMDAYKAQIENIYGNGKSVSEGSLSDKTDTDNLVSRVKTEM